MMLRGDVLLVHFIVCLQELLIRWDTCRDPGVDENLTTRDAPFTSSFSEFQGEVERADSSSSLGSRGVACILKRSGQDAFSYPELF